MRYAFLMHKQPSIRAGAFKAWMAERDTNTKQVAQQAGVPYTTLASFVQGDTQSLKGETEERIAAAYGQSTTDIFTLRTSGMVPIIGRVGADAHGRIIYNTGQLADMAPIPMHGTADAVALEVSGHSMRGFADDGSLVYFENQRTPPTPDLIGYPCVVELVDGRVLLKRLLRGSAPDLFDLESISGPTLTDQRVVWAAEIITIIPPRQARRVIRRAGE